MLGLSFIVPTLGLLLAANDASPARAAQRTDQLGDPLPPGAIARLGSSRWRQGGQVCALSFSADGKTVAAGSFHGTVNFWEAATGKRLGQLKTPQPLLDALAFAPDGRTLVTCTQQGNQIRTWEVATGKEGRAFEKPADRVRALGYSGDTLLAVSWEENALIVHAVSTGKELRRLHAHTKAVLFSAFSADGKTLAAAPRDGTLRLLRMPDGEEVRRLGEGRRRVTALAFSPDGRKLVAAGDDNTIRLWDVATGQLLAAPSGPENGLLAVVLTPDGRLLISAGGDSTVRVWDTATSKEIRRWQGAPQQHPIASVEDPLTKKVHRQFLSLPWVGCLTLSSDGKTVAAGASDGRVYLWDVTSGQELGRFAAHDGKVECVAFAPGCKLLASGGRDGTIRLWQTAIQREVGRIETRQGIILSVVFAPDGKSLASMAWADHHQLGAEPSAAGNTVRFWDIATKSRLAALSSAFDKLRQPLHQGLETPSKRPPRTVHTIALSPDGRTIASLGLDQVIRLWNWNTAREVYHWKCGGHEGDPLPDAIVASQSLVEPLTFSPDGRLLAVGSDSSVFLYETATGKLRHRLDGHQAYITGFAFRGDGATLVTASNDCTALVWDLTGGRLRDGRLLAAGLGKAEMEESWKVLSGDDAAAAGQAIWRLAAAGPQSIAFLKQRVQALKRVGARELEKLIADLDDPRFQVRERATQELDRLDGQAAPALRKALAAGQALEVQRRIEALLTKQATRLLPREQLPGLRAVEVLEHIGTAEAQELLRSLAAGAPEARMTLAARTSLDRLAGRSVKRP
jgi:WD40 repeat protein